VVARSVLRGTGDVRFPALITVGFAWTIAPPLAFWLGLVQGWGALGGWVGLSVQIALGAVVLWWRLERGTWRRAARQSRARLAPVEGEAPGAWSPSALSGRAEVAVEPLAL
jgi:MATE family multidrug resistance protein